MTGQRDGCASDGQVFTLFEHTASVGDEHLDATTEYPERLLPPAACVTHEACLMLLNGQSGTPKGRRSS